MGAAVAPVGRGSLESLLEAPTRLRAPQAMFRVADELPEESETRRLAGPSRMGAAGFEPATSRV